MNNVISFPKKKKESREYADEFLSDFFMKIHSERKDVNTEKYEKDLFLIYESIHSFFCRINSEEHPIQKLVDTIDKKRKKR